MLGDIKVLVFGRSTIMIGVHVALLMSEKSGKENRNMICDLTGKITQNF